MNAALLFLAMMLIIICVIIWFKFDDIMDWIDEFLGLADAPQSPGSDSGDASGDAPGSDSGDAPGSDSGDASGVGSDRPYTVAPDSPGSPPEAPPEAPPAPVDCFGGSWSTWSACSQTQCGQYGKQKRRYIKGPDFVGAKHGGTCKLDEERTCYAGDCPAPVPQNCVLSDWYNVYPSLYDTIDVDNGGTTTSIDVGSDYVLNNFCTKSCGTGIQYQKKDVEISATNGGTCSETSRTISCNTHPCPVDCVGGVVKQDTRERCPHGSKNGVQEYREVYKITTHAKHGGAPCLYSEGDHSHPEWHFEKDTDKKCRDGTRIGKWISLDESTGIVADLLRNPYLQVSPSSIQYIMQKVKLGRYDSIRDASTTYESEPLPHGCRNSFDELKLLDSKTCKSMIKTFNDRFDKSIIDKKLPVDIDELDSVIGYANVQKIMHAGFKRLEEMQIASYSTKWILRRSAKDTTKALPFHKDWDDLGKEYVIVGVNLNDNYSGGILMYICDDNQLHRPQVKVGHATVHDASTIHAVSPITKGERYKLFFCIGPG